MNCKNNDDWVVVYTTNDPIEAEIIRDLLNSGDIEVVLRSSRITPYPVNIGKMGEIKILVKKEDKEIAEGLIRSRDFI